MNKFEIQNSQYTYPYHYIPYFTKRGFCRKRILEWGGEYLSYLKFVEYELIKRKAFQILDVGCGDGRFLNILKEDGSFTKIKGIDLSEQAILLAKAFNPEIDFEKKSIADEKEQWRALTCIEVLEHISDDEISFFIRRMAQLLKPNGEIFIVVPSVNIPMKSKHYRHYTLKVLENQIQESCSGLKLVKGCYIVPAQSNLDKLAKKFFINKICEFRGYDRFRWNRLWRNGLIASEKTGTHVFAVLSKK